MTEEQTRALLELYERADEIKADGVLMDPDEVLTSLSSFFVLLFGEQMMGEPLSPGKKWNEI